MKPVKFIEAETIYLRPFEPEDVDLVYFGKNNAQVRDTLFLFEPISKANVMSQLQAWNNSSENMLFTICENESSTPVGQTALVRIDYISRAAVFYIAIYNPEYWSKGYGNQATALVVQYAFDILNLNRVQLHVSIENTKGIAAYEKAGFKREGILRQAMYHNNKYIDFLVMGILRQEYYKTE